MNHTPQSSAMHGPQKPRGLNFHEHLSRETPRASSNRTFGLVFAGFFATIALWPVHSGGRVRIWAVAVAAVWFVLAVVWPATLSKANSLWTTIGRLLSSVVNPVVAGLLLYIGFLPVGLLVRLMHHDPLHLRKTAPLDTYWLVRNPPGPSADSMTRQF